MIPLSSKFQSLVGYRIPGAVCLKKYRIPNSASKIISPYFGIRIFLFEGRFFCRKCHLLPEGYFLTLVPSVRVTRHGQMHRFSTCIASNFNRSLQSKCAVYTNGLKEGDFETSLSCEFGVAKCKCVHFRVKFHLFGAIFLFSIYQISE